MIYNTFKKNIIILTSSNIIIGVLGSLFGIYCTRIYGAEGTALINIITSINSVFLALMNGGMSTSISKIIAEQHYFKNKPQIMSTIKISVVFSIIWSFFVISAFLIFIDVFRRYFNSDAYIIRSLLVTCPCLIFMSIGNIFKGYFVGLNIVKEPSVIDILEKGFRFVILTLLVVVSKNEFGKYSIVSVYVCFCIGEFISMLLLWIHYKKDTKGFTSLKPTKSAVNSTLTQIIKYALPLCLMGFIGEISSALSSFIVIGRLSYIGYDNSSALALIGKFKGMALLFTTSPIVITSSVCVLLIPKITALISKSNYSHAKVIINKALYISVVVGLSTAIFCTIFSEQIGSILFGRTDLGLMIRLSGLISPIVFTSSTLSSVLIGLNKQKTVFRNSFIQQALLLTGLFVFIAIPSLNIFGYILSMLISSTATLYLNWIEIKKVYTKSKVSESPHSQGSVLFGKLKVCPAMKARQTSIKPSKF